MQRIVARHEGTHGEGEGHDLPEAARTEGGVTPPHRAAGYDNAEIVAGLEEREIEKAGLDLAAAEAIAGRYVPARACLPRRADLVALAQATKAELGAELGGTRAEPEADLDGLERRTYTQVRGYARRDGRNAERNTHRSRAG